MRTKFNKCEDKAWCWSCDEYQSKPYLCFICNETIPYRDSHSHMSNHNNDSNQYLKSRMCKINKHISYKIFKRFRCRICIHLHRYRFGHSKERFREHVKKYNNRERAPLVASQAVSPIVKHGRRLRSNQIRISF